MMMFFHVPVVIRQQADSALDSSHPMRPGGALRPSTSTHSMQIFPLLLSFLASCIDSQTQSNALAMR
jgi:hypothetical protein